MTPEQKEELRGLYRESVQAHIKCAKREGFWPQAEAADVAFVRALERMVQP